MAVLESDFTRQDVILIFDLHCGVKYSFYLQIL
jgi:hypothetical protein